MSSRRKSFTPCMVCVSEVAADNPVEMDVLDEKVVEDQSFPLQHSDLQQVSLREGGAEGVEERHWEGTGGKIEDKQQGRDYHCKYCSFSTPHLNGFKEHVYAAHPNVILNPLYLCAVCNFSTKKFDSLTEHNETQHQGESNFKFKRIKLDNQTILEQTIENEDSSNYPDIEHMQDDDDGFDFLPSYPNFPNIGKPLVDNTEAFINGNEVESHLDLMLKDQITAVNVNGTLIIPEPMVLQGLSHVMPLLQRPPNLNSVPTIAVPLNTSKYNPLLDSNTTLITSFNRFPYPTHAELSWLTAASKHPEEQIKVWFTTQRLKQGITWSPEEVEEARKKMFNGCMPPSHHTFTILPTPVREPVTTSTSVAPAASCQVIGQPIMSSAVCTTVTVTTVNSMQNLKRSLGTPTVAQEVKRPMIPPEEHKEKLRMAPPPVHSLERLPMAPPPVPPDNKRTMLPPSNVPDMKRAIVTPYVLPKGKSPMVFPPIPPKDRVPMAPPPLLTRERLSMVPLVSTDLKRSLVSPKTRNQIPASSVISKDKLSSLPTDVNLPLVPPLVTSQAKRPTIIQTARAKPVAPPLIPTFSLECKPLEPSVEQKPTGSESRPSESQNSNGVPCGDGKNWFTDQSAPAHNGSRHLNSEFAPKERPKMVPTQFPLLERVKGKTAEQLKVLEESFQRNSFPSHNEVDHIAITTRLSREEIDSWFLERRALRDNLEKALLNSMGSKRTETAERRSHPQHQHALLNGVHKQGGLPMSPLPPIIAPTSSSVPLDRKSLNLLKDVFVQTRWPSPEEYSRLEAQTGLARANIVRWFKDSRLSLRSGAGEKKAFLHNLSSGEHNGRLIIDQPCSLARSGQERKMPGGECAKLSSQEIKDWFNSPLGHRRPDVGRNGGQNGGGGQDCGGWGEEAVGVRMASQELVSDTD
ncbi:zinc fingers and homeoboxes protein 2-like [Electrophorus electricus]|uniref:zinc fingers and homeoboxes protein 2-like n=1 Tax=Electrophorus electricus TaxID=8005 RepID=UPI0015CF83CB|nr:zinc fingers and homeoboxes protein 2-like [Electrophorus electricus]XP_026879174.2 zinc fingers and homeoboxes protein 2-like [Electrophorus electricus]